MLEALGPYPTFFFTLIFNGCYCILLCLCLFSVNVWCERNVGWLVAIAIHIAGYVVITNGIITSDLQRFSPLSYAFFVNQFSEGSGITALGGTIMYAVLYYVLVYVTDHHARMVTI